jgi:hypothetical protein
MTDMISGRRVLGLSHEICKVKSVYDVYAQQGDLPDIQAFDHLAPQIPIKADGGEMRSSWNTRLCGHRRPLTVLTFLNP